MIKEFKAFISRGSVVDLAVGVIIGSAFTSIVKSLVSYMINPLIGLFVGRINFSDWVFKINDATFKVGSFINAVINFIIIAFVIFLMVKLINKFRKTETKEPTNTEKYLKDIRDMMKKNDEY